MVRLVGEMTRLGEMVGSVAEMVGRGLPGFGGLHQAGRDSHQPGDLATASRSARAARSAAAVRRADPYRAAESRG